MQVAATCPSNRVTLVPLDADTANATAPPGRIFRAHVVGVCADPAHRFSKPAQLSIRLIAGHGFEGDAHAGAFVKHRYLARTRPQTPNIRHLMPSELFAGLPDVALAPGDLDENHYCWRGPAYGRAEAALFCFRMAFQ